MIYIKENKSQDVESFVKSYFIHKMPATYYDEECSKLQCSNRRARSFADMLELTQTYFPECTKERLSFILRSLINSKVIGSLHCSDVGKIVFYYSGFRGYNCSYENNVRNKITIFVNDEIYATTIDNWANAYKDMSK